MARRARWIFSVLLLFPSSLSAYQEPPPDEPADSVGPTVFLEFGWWPGLSAEVSLVQRMVRSGQGSDSDVTVRSSYRMDVVEHESGLLVRNHDGRLEGFESEPDIGPDNMLVGMYRALSGIEAGYVVSEDGELLDMIGADQAAAAFRASLAPVLDSAASNEEVAPLLQSFEQMLTPEAMTAGAAEQWGAMIWTWAWEELEEGAVYEAESEAPSPLMPDVTIPMTIELGFLEWVPCTDEDDEPTCVSVELYSYPDPDAVVSILDRFVERMSSMLQGARLEFRDFEQENHVQVVLDPTTMVPFAFSTSKVIAGTMIQDGAENPFSRFDESHLVFRYAEEVR